MKYMIEVLNKPNQTLSTRLGGVSISLTLNSFNGITYASVADGDNPICAGVRCIPNMSIIPKWFEERIGGKLYFEGGEDYPAFANFNKVGHRLVYETSRGS